MKVDFVNMKKGENLAKAIWLSGKLSPRALCSAMGRCGRCKVQFLDDFPEILPIEKDLLSENDLKLGFRLACRHVVKESEFSLNISDIPKKVKKSVKKNNGEKCVLAIDVGTTSVAWQIVSINDGKVLDSGTYLNPQAGAGADVIARISYSRNEVSRGNLSKILLDSLRDIVITLKKSGYIIESACLAANCAMTSIALDRDISGLCSHPYRVDYIGHKIENIFGLPQTYIPPQISAFVGGDTSAGLCYISNLNIPKPFFMADLGTNGEMALCTESGKCFVTSVPLGPAIEGIGPECGQLAQDGVITGFSFGSMGIIPKFYDKVQEKALGMSASAFISLLSLLLRVGILNRDGHFVSKDKLTSFPLALKIANYVNDHDQMRLLLPNNVWLCARDVEEILKVKAAFSCAFAALCEKAQIKPSALNIYLSGSLSEYVEEKDLIELGFLPQETLGKIHALGNSSLLGASILARSPKEREKLKEFCDKIEIVDFVTSNGFQEKYLAKLSF